MKKRAVIMFVLFLFIYPICYAQWYLNAEEVDVNLRIVGGFGIRKHGEASLKYVIANLSFFPREYYRQRVERIKISPDTPIEDSSIVYRWDNLVSGDHKFEVDSDIILMNKQRKIKSKVAFPLKNIPEEIIKYTKPSPTADSDNREIIRLANSLAEGEDDLFIVVHKLAEWTKDNIVYNLSTLTASVSEPASWVLLNRRGVCDEITNLFIALSRSLGIPARFISGIAYTESELFTENWGLHGWAEVYFPGYGWVDYDVTYGEFGFIDPTHIKLKDSLDAQEATTKYSWLGRNVDIKTEQIDIKTELRGYSGKFEDNIDITVYPEKSEIGFNSYNMINVKIKNNNGYYVSEELTIYKAKETQLEGSNTKSIFLRPKEEKNVYWIINIGELEFGYIYTFPISIRTSRNKTAATSFAAVNGGAVFSRDEIQGIVDSRKEISEKRYSKDINLSCRMLKEEFYVYEKNKVKCIIENNGNVFFDDMEICFMDECRDIELGISQQKIVEFVLEEKEAGKKEKIVNVEGKEAKRVSQIKYIVLDMPGIEITGLQYPSSVSYKDEYNIEFLLKKSSYSSPVDVEITLNHGGYKKTWTIDEMQQDRKFLIDMGGRDLGMGQNIFDITVNYKDKLGNGFKAEEKAAITLTNLSVTEYILVLINMLARRMQSRRGVIEFIVIIGIVFIVMSLIIFKRKK